MKVEAVMTAPVIGIGPQASIGDAATLMLNNRISGLPVIRDDGTLAGIVSEGDFLRRAELGTRRRRSWWLELLVGPGKAADEYVHSHSRRVSDVMVTDVVTVERDAPLESAVELMIGRGIKRLPVLGGGKVVGIVTRSDFMRALLRAIPGPDARPTDDEKLRQAILKELEGKPWSVQGSIRVKVDQGAVELEGFILDERVRPAVRVAAENVPGVKSVTDHLAWLEPVSGMVISPMG